MHKILITLSCLILIGFISPVISQTTGPQNPVVIQYGELELTRRQFELEFELNMVLNAVQNGVPVKNQQEIMTMQHQYLSQRANEMILLTMSVERGISISDEEIMTGINSTIQELGFSEFSSRTMSKLGIVDEQIFKNYVKERQIISKLITQIKKELEGNDNDRSFKQLLSDEYQKRQIKTFPERLRSPLARRFEE